MTKNKNEKKTLWIYIIVFFTVVFILLIITAFSQIKFNKNIDEYKNKIANEQSDKNKYQLNLNSALEENKTLHTEVDKLNKSLDDLNNQLSEKNNEVSSIQEKYKNALSFYENLMKAEKEYNDGNIIECAIILKKQVVKEDYDSGSRELYNRLAELSYFTASESLYFEGYRLYSKSMYTEAIDRFKNSILISESEYFSDDCYYYIAYSEYNAGNIDASINYMKDLVSKYPDSIFKEGAQKFINDNAIKQ